MKKEIDLDLSVIDNKLNYIAQILNDFDNFTGFSNFSKSKIDNFVYKMPFNLFSKYCYLTLHPQSYGSKFQERFRRQYNFTKVASKQKSGDMTNGSLNIEYKVSLFDNKNPTINIVQLQRPNHKVDYYIIQIIDVRDIEKCNLYTTWYLSKEQMKNECNLAGNNSAHGDEGLSGLRIDFEFNSESFNRFEKNYLLNENEFIAK